MFCGTPGNPEPESFGKTALGAAGIGAVMTAAEFGLLEGSGKLGKFEGVTEPEDPPGSPPRFPGRAGRLSDRLADAW